MSRLVWFAPRPVWPLHGGGQVRTAGLIEVAILAGHEVLLLQPPGDLAPGRDAFAVHEVVLASGVRGVVAKLRPPYALRSPRADVAAKSAIIKRVRAFAPDLAIVSCLHAWSLAGPMIGRLPVVYDAHNDETELYEQFLRSADGLVDRATFWVDRGRVRRTEQALVDRAAAVVAVSEADAEVFRSRAPRGPVVVVPSSVPLPDLPATPAATPPSILFVGSLDYPPNVAALTELLSEVLPDVRRTVADARVVVVGRRPGPALRTLMADDSLCSFHEGAPDISQYYREARCVVLPIRSGGGSRLKVYEALAYGVPLVATREALAGVPLVAGRDVLTGQTPGELAAAAVRLLQSPSNAAALGVAGRSAFEADLSWSAAGRPFEALLRELI